MIGRILFSFDMASIVANVKIEGKLPCLYGVGNVCYDFWV
jgi:hypothetical protein